MQQVRLELDSNVRRGSNGTALMGGSPFRLIRLSAAGSQLLNDWLTGTATPASGEATKLRDRLIRGGMVHPVFSPVPTNSPEVTSAFVVPVHNDSDGLDRLLGMLRSYSPDSQVVVVDDASADVSSVAAIVAAHGADFVHHDVNRGPAAARNTGWRSVLQPKVTSPGDVTFRPEVIVFVDADVVPSAAAIQTLLAHFVDPAVSVVAPRVAAEPGADRIAAYEADNSPLDMGSDAALVFPGTRTSYVPSAMLVVRTNMLEGVGGFDEAMRYGEDVDMVWRLIQHGHLVRFEPAAVVHHRNRPSVAAFARQRFTYGSSAAELAARHGDKVSPLQLPANITVTTLGLLLGGRRLRLVAAAATASGIVALTRKLTGKVDAPAKEAARLTVMTHGYAVHGLAAAVTRSWAPLLVWTSRSRRALATALVVPAMIDWFRTRPANNLVTHTAFRALDHGSYCAGVWAGVLRSRSVAALLPKVRIGNNS